MHYDTYTHTHTHTHTYIHVIILYSIILNITDNKPKTKYIIAVDDSQNTQEEIVKVTNI